MSVRDMNTEHVVRALRQQMLTIQTIEDKLHHLLSDELSEDWSIEKQIKLLNMRYKRYHMLKTELSNRGKSSINLDKWENGEITIPGVYQYASQASNS